jgi:hypothetical protein
MKLEKSAAALLIGVLLAGVASAQDRASLGQVPLPSQLGPLSSGGFYNAAGGNPFAPAADPRARPAAYLAEEPAANGNGKNGEEEEKDEPPKQWKLFNGPRLEKHNIDVRGWIDQGYTWNPDNPVDRFNGPVTFNDRSNAYQLNQLYLIMERVTKTDKQDWDIGGRADLLYGTDQRFTVATGLETQWNEGERFYGLAMPQLYGDIAFKKWTFRFGHFYTLHGNEVVMAPDNFFYSHAYSFQYGEPFTHTGMMLKYQLSERLSLMGAIVEGWDNWTDQNKKAGFLGGVNWTGPNEKTSVAWALTVSNEQPAGIDGTRTLSTVVITQKLGEKWKYIFQNDDGFESNVGGGGTNATWYSFDNYLLYEVNDKWSYGARYEWFIDQDGTRVAGIGLRDGFLKGIPLTAIPAQWQEATVGLNYKHNANTILRSELRWDWATPIGVATWTNPTTKLPAHGPFDDFTKRHQFLWSTDLIVRY